MPAFSVHMAIIALPDLILVQHFQNLVVNRRYVDRRIVKEHNGLQSCVHSRLNGNLKPLHFSCQNFGIGSFSLHAHPALCFVVLIFKIILNPTIGIVNKLLHVSINWVSDPKYALICVAVLTAWLNSCINFLYFSAGLGNIDDSIYERASVDGANAVQKFFKLTLPGLSPIMFYTLVVNIIQAFQSFGQVKILTQGGPGESTNLIVYSIYRGACFNYRFGSAAAQSVVLFLIVMALTLVMFRMEKRGVKY